MSEPALALFAYNRPVHTRLVLEGLRKNGISRLHVFHDGLKPGYPSAPHEEVKALLAQIDFCEVKVVRREENRGLAGSIVSGVGELLAAHESVIVLEDDCVPSSKFVELMSSLLSRYRDQPRVFAVSGYAPPGLPEDYPYDICFSPLSSSWGWATWRDRWARYDPLATGWQEVLETPTLRARFDAPGKFFSRLLRQQMTQGADSWAIRWYYALYKNQGVCAWPIRSFIDNIGSDGSGVHGDTTDQFAVQLCEELDASHLRVPPTLEFDPRIQRLFQSKWPGRSLAGTLRQAVSPKAWHALLSRKLRAW